MLTSTIKEIIWLLVDMRVSLSYPTPMYCDNQSSIQIAHNSVFHEQTKHIEIDCHLTHQFFANCRFLFQVAFHFPFLFSGWQTLNACSCRIVSLMGNVKKYIYHVLFIKGRMIFLI